MVIKMKLMQSHFDYSNMSCNMCCDKESRRVSHKFYHGMVWVHINRSGQNKIGLLGNIASLECKGM